jgi:cytochrome c oxidase assembly protein subunit 15
VEGVLFMRNFKALSMASVLATYFLIFLGGLVRVSGAGLGCPDWPKCFGGWIPPLSIRQLPAHIDPNLFNFTLAWIEYVNRLVGVIVGLLVAVLAIWAIIKYTKRPRILIPSIAAALLVAFQGWQGGQIVATHLEPVIVSVHLLIAMLIVSLLIYITQQAHYLDNPDSEKDSNYPNKAQAWVVVIWVFTIIQIVLGTQLRESIESAIKNYPLLFDQALISKVGAIKYVHPLFGIFTAIFIVLICRRLISSNSKPSPLVWQSAVTLYGLTILQLALGVVMVFVGLPQVAQVTHLWVSSLMIGMILIAYTALSHKREVENA